MEAERKAVIIRPPLSCHWGPNEECVRNGKVTRLSVTYQSCFVQTKAPASDGESMFLKLWLPDEFMKELALANNFLLLEGRVKGYAAKVGFGFQFNPSEHEQQLLTLLIGHLHGARGA